MNIDQFLSMRDGEIMTADQTERLNSELATISVSDIPAAHISKIAEYLATALNIKSIDEPLVDALGSLLQSIQEVAV